MRKYYVRHAQGLMRGSWEAETSIYTEAVDPVALSLEGTSMRENYSDDWLVPLE
jgi:hypothetical protein